MIPSYIQITDSETSQSIIVDMEGPYRPILGYRDRKSISTSCVERQNLTLRMQMRRFTRLTNAFSKKLDNLKATLALHFFYYNFMRIHQSLRMTPAMATRISKNIWTWEKFLGFGK